jgi:hypothetical protein
MLGRRGKEQVCCGKQDRDLKGKEHLCPSHPPHPTPTSGHGLQLGRLLLGDVQTINSVAGVTQLAIMRLSALEERESIVCATAS